MVKCKTISKKDIVKGGVFTISEYELETLQSEFAEINNIIALAKADNGVKKILLLEILKEFGNDLFMLSDKIIEDIIEGITETVNENIEIEGLRHDLDLTAYGNIPDRDMTKLKAWIKQKMGITC